MRHILFVYGSLHVGGIETFLVRVSKRLAAHGTRVTVLLASRDGNAALIDELGRSARLVYFDELQRLRLPSLIRGNALVRFLAPLSRRKVSDLLADVDHLHFFESLSLLAVLNLLATAGDCRKVSGGVYYQYEYATWSMKPSFFVRAVAQAFQELIPARNLIFFNETSRATYARHVGMRFAASAVLPIGVDLSRLEFRPPDAAAKGKVVSIGRIASFKTYNFQFPPVLTQLNGEGLALEYHVYGDGDQRGRLEELRRSLPGGERIILHGPVAYDQIPAVLRDAWLFVGSGTALIEAAACGIPALVGIESEPGPVSYGFLHNMEGIDYQESDLGLAKRGFAQFCRQLHAMSASDYALECERSARKSREFSIERFMEGLLKVDAAAGEIDGERLCFQGGRLLASAALDRLLPSRLASGFWTRYEPREHAAAAASTASSEA